MTTKHVAVTDVTHREVNKITRVNEHSIDQPWTRNWALHDGRIIDL